MIGNPDHYKVCRALFVCGTELASEKGMDGLLVSNFEKAKALLKEAGYDGTPIVLLHSTDVYWQTNLAPVAKQLMEKAGFKVDMQSLDWQTIVARMSKRSPPGEGGWHAVLYAPGALELLDPAANRFINSACERTIPGWPCDPVMERLATSSRARPRGKNSGKSQKQCKFRRPSGHLTFILGNGCYGLPPARTPPDTSPQVPQCFGT